MMVTAAFCDAAQSTTVNVRPPLACLYSGATVTTSGTPTTVTAQ